MMKKNNELAFRMYKFVEEIYGRMSYALPGDLVIIKCSVCYSERHKLYGNVSFERHMRY
jgi:signal peptidase I